MSEQAIRILVIDDDPASVALFCEIAELEGFEVKGITDPQSLDAALVPTPDIILLDLLMSDIDGIEILRELKERSCFADLILVSGGDKRMLKSVGGLAKRMGFSVLGELCKPILPDQLLLLLRKERQEKALPASPDYMPELEELRRAFARKELVVEYQPMVLLIDGQWSGVEALVRWHHPERGLVGPNLFVEAMERHGFGPELTECVVANVVQDLPAIKAAGLDGTIFVNLPASALTNVKFADRIMSQIDEAGIDHRSIGFELTETSLVQDRIVGIDIMARLRLKECWLSIDDFGTGHSTLATLYELPFTELKIDHSFVLRLEADAVARSIVHNSIRLAQDLAIRAVGEGVESESLYLWLRDQGCTLGQGYYIGRPMAANQLPAWYLAWQERRPAAMVIPEGGDFSHFDAFTPGADTSFCVFAVDDEPLMRAMVEDVLSGECAFESFASAKDCLERLGKRKPDLLLLDLAMPVMTGYELCRRLKEDFDTQDIPVFFISGEESSEARLAAYEAGGVDFIAKPFLPAELIRRVRAVRQTHEAQLALKEMAGYAQRTAFTAMTSMGELGVVIEFLRRSFACSSASELAVSILDSVVQYGLSGAVQILTGGEFYTLSALGENIPLEVSVLKNLRTQGRIFEFKNRSVYNYGKVSLMVKDIPLDDLERCGRIRDNLAILAEGADACLQAIELDQANRVKEAGIGGAAQSIRQTLTRLRENRQKQSFESIGLINELQEDLLNSYLHLGLTTGQETFLSGMVQHYMERLVEKSRQSDDLAGELEALAGSLKDLGGA